MGPQELIQSVKTYNPQADTDLILKAYAFAEKAHARQVRESGEAYLSHPLAVAKLLSDKRLDTASIVAGLLHDTVEDTDVSLSHVRNSFGDDVHEIVDGLTKLSSVTYESRNQSQAENFRKFLLASVHDIRVLLVKLADKIHNMRTLEHVSNSRKRFEKARETMEIYVPLAERIGLRDWKNDLEDNAFRWTNPEAWKDTHERLSLLGKQEVSFFNDVCESFTDDLKKEGLEAQITGREKKPYSIWRKMQAKELAFEHLSDIYAFRVVVDTIPQCYHALGILHATYQGLSNRFKDYISVPKQNGYQSIHTEILLLTGIKAEVQIRTKAMNERAEFGIAAHWHYKEKGSTDANPYDGHKFRWLTHLIEILDDASDVQEFIQNSKLDLYAEAVFVFTPKGELRTLPTGATPIDLAYSLHTDLGHHCVGAKVNGRIIPIREALQNGDVVEILTHKGQKPSREWESCCITGKARSAIRRFLRSQDKEHFVNLGTRLLERRATERGYTITDKILQKHISTWSCSTVEELMVKLGQASLSPITVVNHIFPDGNSSVNKAPVQKDSKKKPAEGSLPICGLVDQMAVDLARCCFPIPGDDIVGIIWTGRGVTVHRRNCRQLQKSSPEKNIPIGVYWDDAELENGEYVFTARIRIVIKDQRGAIAEATAAISKQNGNITSFRTVRRNVAFFEALINVDVPNLLALQNIISVLSACRNVSSVNRSIV